jgi:hypothetical protein
MAIWGDVEIDRGPNAKAIFDREDRCRHLLEQVERRPELAPDRYYRFQDDAGHVDDDQQRQRHIDQQGQRTARLFILEDHRELPA